MRKWTRLAAVIALVGCAISGCTSYPAMVQLDPARFENKTLRVEWAVGSTFFRLKITNLTDSSFDLDLVNSAVVSVDGEARYLLAAGRKDPVVIPPRSYIVVASDQGAVFGTDIFGRFNAESEEKYPLPGGIRAEDRPFLKSHSGETLRLYLLADVEGKKTVFDILFKITGATRVLQSGSEDKSTAAPPPPPPLVNPPPPAKK